jgi:hypothetical protein
VEETLSLTNPHWPPATLEQERRRLLARLPACAQRKYRALLAAADDADVLQRAAHSRGQQLDDEIIRLQQQRPYCTDETALAALDTEISAVGAELTALYAEGAARGASKANADQVLAQLHSNFLVDQAMSPPRPGFEAAARRALHWPLHAVQVSPELRSGESYADAVGRVRDELSGAVSALGRVRAAPELLVDQWERLTDAVDAHARRGRVYLLDGQLRWPDMLKHASGARAAPEGGASAMIAWLLRDQLLAHLQIDLLATNGVAPADLNAALAGTSDAVEALNKLSEQRGGISAEERGRRIYELERAILGFEHQEEALITAAHAAGDVAVLRRPGASGWALLSISPGEREQQLVAAE